ncbi:MAG: TIGR04282 family arsenosugar biosynthesis glycosyltransferase [Saprospiraceae bacterium]
MALLLFIKNPRLGHVKTRLARTLGDAEALRIYRFLLDKTRETALRVDVERMLFYSEQIQHQDDWSPSQFDKFVQAEGDLGVRMCSAFETAFAKGANRAVIIGSDCPELDPDTIHAAFEALNTHEVVLGPSADGGYYLLGMRRLWPTLFEGIQWSTAAVLTQTLDKAEQLGLSVYSLQTLLDIDEEMDWYDYKFRTGN